MEVERSISNLDGGELVELCAVDDLPEGSPRKVVVGSLEIALYNVGGEFYATDDMCTHGPGRLSDGWLDGFEIECDFHQGCFDIRTGEVTAPPCMVPVKTYSILVQDGRVYLEI